MKGEVEATVDYVKRSVTANRKMFFWAIWTLVVIWLAVRIKEVTLLLFVSYAVALLIDPFVTRMEKRGVSRGISIVALAALLFVVFAAFLGIAIPQVVDEYTILSENFPAYIERFRQWIGAKAELHHLGLKEYFNREELWTTLKTYLSYLGEDRMAEWLKTLGSTLLNGYSLALTLLNLILLPFFIYYFACDLHDIHRAAGSYLSPQTRDKTAEIGGEIVNHVAVFFRGQMLVAFILAVMYVAGLFLVGLPSALVVGGVAGFLGLIPYLGVSIGVMVATMITLVNEPTWGQLFSVWAVFVVVQTLEGTIITPKIVGEKLGIHPLGVMVALIVGGHLLGLLGVFIAIPAAAAVMVLFRHAMQAVDVEAGDQTQLELPGIIARKSLDSGPVEES